MPTSCQIAHDSFKNGAGAGGTLVGLVDFYSGPVVPNWAASTDEDILRRLVDAGKLELPSVFRVWDEVLARRREDQYVNHADFVLVQVWGVAVRDLSESDSQDLLTSDTKILEKAERLIKEPLIAHRDYKRWSEHLNHVLWVLLCSWAIGRACHQTALGKGALALARRAAALAEDERLIPNAIGEMKGMAEYVIQDLGNFA